MSRERRDRVAGAPPGAADLLIATDVAARGLDIEHLTHVVNHNVPSAAKPTCTASAAWGGPAERRRDHPREAREHRMLKPFSAARAARSASEIPTVADLRARRVN